MKSDPTGIADKKKNETTANPLHQENGSGDPGPSPEELAQFYFMGRRPSGYPNQTVVPRSDGLTSHFFQEYPLYIPENPGKTGEQSLYRLLREAVNPQDGVLERGGAREAIFHNLNLWVEIYRKSCSKSHFTHWVTKDHEKLTQHFLNAFESSPESKKNLEEELKSIVSRLPSSGNIFPFSQGIHLQSALHLLQAKKTFDRMNRLKALKELASHLKDLIEVHKSHFRGPVFSSDKSPSMQAINLENLSNSLPKYKGAKLIEPDRLEAMMKALEVLQKSLKTFGELPTLVVFSSLNPKSIDTLPKAIQWENSQNPLDAAKKYLKQLGQIAGETLRAARLAQIETGHLYREDIHPAYLESLKWDFLNGEENGLLPDAVIYEKFNGLGSLDSLTDEYPLKILLDYSTDDIIQKTEQGYESQNISFSLKQIFGLKCFVSHANSCSSSQLLENLRQFSNCKGLAISMACVPEESGDSKTSFKKMVRALKSRLTPYLRYNPLGKGLSQSFSIDLNPDLEVDWSMEGDAGETAPMTPAHFMLMEKKFASEFLSLADNPNPERLLNISEYLEKMPFPSPDFFPTANLKSTKGGKSLFALSQTVTQFCEDVLSQWRALQELGGINNYHVERTKAQISEEWEAKHREALEALKAAHAGELEEVKQTEGALALEKLAQGLLNLNIGEISVSHLTPENLQGPPPGTEEPSAEETKTEKTETEKEAPKAKESPQAPSGDMEAYIDSELCTSCNDCTNINNRMFKYNSNKEAEIADVTQGTFAELVKAAIKCPAKCIHPGTPRPGDKTATTELIAQAEAYN